MKKIFASLIVGLASLFGATGRAQLATHADSLHAAGYLFPDFVDGRVLMKSGSTEKALLNYNTNNQGIGFMKEGQYLELTGLETIDTVYIYEKKFVPYHEKFYLVVSTSFSMPLLELIYNKPIPQTATNEHYGLDKRNSNSVSNNVTNAYSNRNFRSYFELTYLKKIFLQKGRVLLKVNNQQEIIDIYPEKKDLIKSFVKENKTNFNKEDDVVGLLSILN
jgi:hypothetical protein